MSFRKDRMLHFLPNCNIEAVWESHQHKTLTKYQSKLFWNHRGVSHYDALKLSCFSGVVDGMEFTMPSLPRLQSVVWFRNHEKTKNNFYRSLLDCDASGNTLLVGSDQFCKVFDVLTTGDNPPHFIPKCTIQFRYENVSMFALKINRQIPNLVGLLGRNDSDTKSTIYVYDYVTDARTHHRIVASKLSAMDFIENTMALAGDGVTNIVDIRTSSSLSAVSRVRTNSGKGPCVVKLHKSRPLIATGYNSNFLAIWDLRTNGVLTDTDMSELDIQAAIKAFDWSNCGNRFVMGTGAGQRTLSVCEYNSIIKPTHLTKCQSQVCQAFFTQSEMRIITSHGFANSMVGIWDVGDDAITLNSSHNCTGNVQHACKSSDDSKIFSMETVMGENHSLVKMWTIDQQSTNSHQPTQITRIMCGTIR